MAALESASKDAAAVWLSCGPLGTLIVGQISIIFSKHLSMGFGKTLGHQNDTTGAPKLRKRVEKGQFGHPSGLVLNPKPQCRNVAET